MEYLNNLQKEIKSFFLEKGPDVLLNKIVNEEITIDLIMLEIQRHFSEFTLVLLREMSKSVLSGEYIYDKKFPENIKLISSMLIKEKDKYDSFTLIDKYISENIKNLKEEIASTQFSTDQNSNKFRERYNKLTKLCETIKPVYNPYKILIEQVLSLISRYWKIYLNAYRKIELFEQQERVFSEETEDITINIENKNLILLNESIFDLAEYDFLTDLDTYRQEKKLLNIRKNLSKKLKEISSEDKEELRALIDIALVKCNYYIAIHFNSDFIYLSSKGEEKIALKNLDLEYLKKALELNKIISNKKDEYKGSKHLGNQLHLIDTYSKEETKYKLIEFIISMKYYKNGKRKLDPANKLIDIYRENRILKKEDEGNQSEIQELYDSFANESILCYLTNSKYSLSLELNGTDYSKIKEEINDLENSQSFFNVKNYYPHKKTAYYLINSLNKDINQDNFILDVIDDKILKLEEAIDQWVESLEWCKDRNFYPFHLPFNESIYDTGIDGFKVFVPVITKPINYKQEEETLNDAKLELSFFKKQRTLLNQIRKNNMIVRSLRGAERRNLEMLTIFSGVITFLFGTTIQLFIVDNKLSFVESIRNMGIIGLVIMLFVTSILTVSPLFINQGISWREYLNKPRNYIFAILLLFLGFIIYSCYSKFCYVFY